VLAAAKAAGAAEIVTVCEAFAAHASIDLESLLDDREGLARAAARDGIRVAAR